MSMELMVLAMKAKVGNPLRKLVLLKLADNASDIGECWPSHQHIADLCEIGKSTVRKHIKTLADEGFLTITTRKGIKGNDSNIYKLHLREKLVNPMLSGSTPMPPDSTPCATSEQPLCHQIAPESVNESINESNKKNKQKKSDKTSLDFSCWPTQANEQVLQDWMQLRKSKRAPVSQTVINKFGKELQLAAAEGWSVDDCLTECITRAWTGFEFAWLCNLQRQFNQPQYGVEPIQPEPSIDWTQDFYNGEDPLV